MTITAAKPIARKPEPVRASSWGDYDPHFPSRKVATAAQGAPIAPTLNLSNSPYFPSLAGTSRG